MWEEVGLESHGPVYIAPNISPKRWVKYQQLTTSWDISTVGGLRCHLLGPFSHQMRNVHATIRTIRLKDVHLELAETHNVPFSKFYKLAKFGYAFPGRVKQFAWERIKNDVDPTTLCLTQHIWTKRVVSRIEDPTSGELKVVHQMLDLLIVAHGCVNLILWDNPRSDMEGTSYLSTDHLTDLYSGITDSTRRWMNQNSLWKTRQ